MKAGNTAFFALAALALSAGTTAACDHKGSGEGAGPTASASATESPTASTLSSAAAASASAAAFAAKGRARHHAGVAGALLRGAYELDLDDAQKATLEKAEDELNAEKATGPAAAIKALNTDLVAGIRASKVDTAKLQADYAAIDKTVLDARAKETKAVVALHAALTPAQRQTLADRVRAHQAQRHPMGAGDGGATEIAKMRLTRITAQLGLDDAQQKSVAAILAKDPTASGPAIQARRDAAQKDLDAVLDAFQKDPFDATKLAVEPGGAKSPHEMMQHHAEFTVALLPILHADQREKLAVQTERQGNRPPRGMAGEDMEPGPPSMGAE
jgi:Spy/CpxP family protein refolding chaperone